MQFVTNLWNFLNGSKTQIGAVAALALVFLGDVENSLAVHAAWLDTVGNVLSWVATTFGVTGVAHKAVKAMDASAPPAPPK